MKIGVFGIKSSHFGEFRKSFQRICPNGEHKITDFWGYDAPDQSDNWNDLTPHTTPEELIDSVDAVMITFRDGTQHAAFAKKVLDAGKPLFIDKPFTCDTKEALELVSLAKEHNVPLTGGSTIPFTDRVKEVKAILPKTEKYRFLYQANPFAVYGGWYFYGSHSTDLCVHIFGTYWKEVSTSVTNGTLVAEIKYPDFSVTLKTTPEYQEPRIIADKEYSLKGENSYDAGIRHFVAVLEGREAGCAETLVSSVELANAILTSARTESIVKNSLIK